MTRAESTAAKKTEFQTERKKDERKGCKNVSENEWEIERFREMRGGKESTSSLWTAEMEKR